MVTGQWEGLRGGFGIKILTMYKIMQKSVVTQLADNQRGIGAIDHYAKARRSKHKQGAALYN